MKKHVLPFLCASVSMLALSAWLEPAQAQEQAQAEDTADNGNGQDEIVVTARRREESLQRAPVAVSVVTADQLRTNLATSFEKLSENVPQVAMVRSQSGTGATISIRGISTATYDSGLDQSVVVEVDGVPMSRGRIISAPLFDLAQVEVLQGPQSLIFGKNSPAGVISLQSASPTDTFEGYAVTGWEFNSHEAFAEGAISGPLTDTLSARLAFRASDLRGWVRNVAEPVQDFLDPSVTIPGANWGEWGPNTEEYSGRLSLRWEPNSDFEANFRLTANLQNSNSLMGASEPYCIDGHTDPVIAGSVPLDQSDCEADGVKAQAGIPAIYAENFPGGNGGVPESLSEFYLASLNLTQDFGNLTLTSSTGYYDQFTRGIYNSDWSEYSTIWAADREEYSLWTQEFRLASDYEGPFNFMMGVYYERSNRDFYNAADLFHEYNPIRQNYAAVETAVDAEGEAYSAFAELRYELTPTLELSGGARFTHEEKEVTTTNMGLSPTYAAFLRPVGDPLTGNYEDDSVTPEVTLNWEAADNHTLFISYRTGYKAGGVSSPFLLNAGADADSLLFDPEQVEGFEGGWKATVFNGALRFDLVGYRYEYEDLQVSAYNAATISYSLQNAASALVWGIQGSADWYITEDFRLRGNFGYNRARYESFTTAQCYTGQTPATGCVFDPVLGANVQDLSGEPLLRAPELTFAVGADYEMQLWSDWIASYSATATHTASYSAAGDYAPGGDQDAYWVVNASARFGPENGAYEFALVGRNLTDSYYTQSVLGWSGAQTDYQYVGYFSRPREIVLQATLRF